MSDIATGTAPVLILLYNGWEDVIELAPRLLAEGHEVWIFDNASPDDRSTELLAAAPEVHYCQLGNNWGWAGGYNRAIRHVRRDGVDAVYILNSDGVPAPGAIETAVRSLDHCSEAAAIGSVMLTDQGDKVFFDGEFHYDERLARDVPAQLIKSNRIHGGGFALNLKAFDEVGPFHEPYFLYHEESEWCFRATAAGWCFFVDGQSRVVHEGRGSDINSNSDYYLIRNRYLARRRGYPMDEVSIAFRRLLQSDLNEARDLPSKRDAILDGVIDGVLGRSGKRPAKQRSALIRNVSAIALRGVVYAAEQRRKLLGS